jgi:hypothetical protein
MNVPSLVTTNTRVVGTGEALRSVKTSCHMTKNAITRYFSSRLPFVYTGEARHDTGARHKLALNQHSCQVALILHLVTATSCHTLHGKVAPLIDCKASGGCDCCSCYLPCIETEALRMRQSIQYDQSWKHTKHTNRAQLPHWWSQARYWKSC